MNPTLTLPLPAILLPSAWRPSLEKARQFTPIVPATSILTGRNLDVEIVRRRKKPVFHPDNDAPRRMNACGNYAIEYRQVWIKNRRYWFG